MVHALSIGGYTSVGFNACESFSHRSGNYSDTSFNPIIETGTEGVEDQGRKRETEMKGTNLGSETPAGGRVIEARGRRVRLYSCHDYCLLYRHTCIMTHTGFWEGGGGEFASLAEIESGEFL